MCVGSPDIIYMISGKRKSGKDFISDRLKARIGEAATIVRIAGPIKYLFSQHKNLDFARMLTADEYKEKFRVEMVEFQDREMARDDGFFCKESLRMYAVHKFPVWIVSDLRREEELEYFRNLYKDKVVTIRVEASMDVRAKRGFMFTPGIDDHATEQGLDNHQHWHYRFENNAAGEDLVEPFIQTLNNLRTSPEPRDKLQMGYKSIMRTNDSVSESG